MVEGSAGSSEHRPDPRGEGWRRCRHLRLPGRWTQPSRTWPEDPAFGDLRPSPAPLGSRDAESESKADSTGGKVIDRHG